MDIRNYSLYFFESGTDMINVNRAKTITTGFNSSHFANLQEALYFNR